MNDQDLRDCFAMFAMMAVMPVMGGKTIGVGQDEGNAQFAGLCFSLADAMMEARNKEPEDDDGIARIKKRKYVRKN
jgi:hypothetical protein